MSARYPRAVKPNYALDVANIHASYLGAPKLADDDWFVVSADMEVGAYTLAHTTSGDSLARNVVVKHTATGNADTLGTVVVAGTDLEGAVITETITPSSGTSVAGATAFATITSVTGVDWVTNQAADKIEVGFGNLIGLPRNVTTAINVNGAVVMNGIVGGTVVATPTVHSTTTLSDNTVDLSGGTYNGTKKAFLLVVTP